MPSDLQRVARGLVECLDEVPQVVAYLQRTAERCRENAALAISASRGQATVAAQQLDAAARACEQAAHYLSMAPPKAKAWAERLVGASRSGDRPDASSADRNKATGGVGDVAERDLLGRVTRTSLPFKPLEDAEGKEPPLITVARKAFEKFRKKQEKEEEQREQPEELEVEIVVAETGELEVLDQDPFEERDFEIQVDLTAAATELLKAMEESGKQTWTAATITLTLDRVTATFTYPDLPEPSEPPVIDVQLPEPPGGSGDDLEPAAVVLPDIGDLSVEQLEFKEFRARLVAEGRVRPAVGSEPEMEFQRRYCGPTEFRLTSDDRLPRAVWADGLDELLRRAQDAKYVAPAVEKSFYRPQSLPPFLRKIAEEKNDHMLLKYREVIRDSDNPVEELEIITNDQAAAAYFADRLRALDIPGQVTVEQRDGS